MWNAMNVRKAKKIRFLDLISYCEEHPGSLIALMCEENEQKKLRNKKHIVKGKKHECSH